jgi:hypothetical protein
MCSLWFLISTSHWKISHILTVPYTVLRIIARFGLHDVCIISGVLGLFLFWRRDRCLRKHVPSSFCFLWCHIAWHPSCCCSGISPKCQWEPSPPHVNHGCTSFCCSCSALMSLGVLPTSSALVLTLCSSRSGAPWHHFLHMLSLPELSDLLCQW